MVGAVSRPPSTPPATAARIAALDVLRGVAILGTLATNVWLFTDPQGLLGSLQSGQLAATGPWRTTELVLRQLANGKFLGLLTIMFGIGLELQRRSARRRGRPWPGTYPVRAALLLLDGVVHYVLVVEFDVLMGYAVTGCVVAYLLVTSPRAQRTCLVAAAAVHVLLLSGVTALVVGSSGQVGAPLDPNPYADGSFGDLAVFRLENALLFRAEVIFILPLSVALFLLGALLVRAGVLEPAGAALRRRLLVLGLGVALPLDLLVGLLGGSAGLLASRYGTAPLVALGLLALVAEIGARRPLTGRGSRALTAVGRTALSCYVLQNVVASALCYGWGLGWAARFGDARVPATVGVYLLVAATVVAAAVLWLRRFDQGPLEALRSRSHRAVVGWTSSRSRGRVDRSHPVDG